MHVDGTSHLISGISVIVAGQVHCLMNVLEAGVSFVTMPDRFWAACIGRELCGSHVSGVEISLCQPPTVGVCSTRELAGISPVRYSEWGVEVWVKLHPTEAPEVLSPQRQAFEASQSAY